MTVLSPHIPFDPLETPLSFAARLGRIHLGEGPVSFLNCLGIKVADLKTGANGAIDALSARAGVDPEPVLANAARQIGKRRYDLRGHVVSAEFLSSPDIRYCPACLLEDDARQGLTRGRRTRLIWTLRGVRTCPAHGLPLRTRKPEAWDDFYIAVNCPNRFAREVLEAECAEATPRPVSPLQNYLTDRLEGRAGPAWLDGQTIEQAQWATEMLGAVLAFGPDTRPADLTDDHWDEAGRIGFTNTADGEAGIRAALTQIVDGFTYTAGKPGPQKILGPLYTSLAAGRATKDRGPIKDLLRAFIFDNFAYPAGAEVLGGSLPERRLHTVASLAAEQKLDPRTLRNALISAGLVPEDAPAHFALEVAAGQEVATSIQRLVHLKELPKVLNCSRPLAQQLMDDRILPPVIPVSVAYRGYKGRAADRQDVETLLARIAELVPMAAPVPADHVDIAKAAEKLKVPAIEIVHVLLAGALKKAVRVEDTPGFAGVRVDLSETRARVRQIRDGRVSPGEAGGALRVPNETLWSLIDSDAADLKLSHMKGPTGYRIPRIRAARLAAFHAEYSSLPDYAERYDMRCPDLGRAVEAMGARPAFRWDRFGTNLFRRADLEAFRPP